MNRVHTLDETIITTSKVEGLTVEHSIPSRKLYPHKIIFIHGMFSTGAMFRKMMHALSQLGYQCAAITLRGHGDSKPVEDLGKVSINDYVDDVEIVLAHESEPIILAGQSMGELIAGLVARRNISGRVVRHIGMTCAPDRGVLMGWEMVKRLPKYLWKILTRKSWSMTPEDAKVLLFNTIPEADLEKCLSQMGPESGRAALEIMCWLYLLKRLPCPSLLIMAKRDKITPRQNQIAKRLGATLAEVDCGHMVMLDPKYRTAVSIIDQWIHRQLPDKGFPA